MKKQMESMEMEVMEARLIRASELNGEMDDDETGNHCPPHTHTQTSLLLISDVLILDQMDDARFCHN